MKNFKLTASIFIMLMIASSMVFSQTKQPVKTQNVNQEKTTQVNTGRNFVDQNKDGICDNRQNKNAGNYCRKGHCCGKGKGNGYQHRNGWKK